MQQLATIGKHRVSGYNVRNAVRIVLFDGNGRVLMVSAPKLGYYKLPGGGIERGESKRHALIRETREEVGATFRITGTVGTTVEWRNKWHLRQTSYCYTGRIVTKGSTRLTQEERERGFRSIWFPTIDAAIAAVNRAVTKEYEGTFIKRRELAFLKHTRAMMTTR